MEGIDSHIAACCNIPPVISEGYEPKGKYETLGGLKTDVTGPTSAKKAILVIYDIFGFFPQTIQGADILATAREYQVFMPDFFEGEPVDIVWYPPVSESQKNALYSWFPSRVPETGVAKIPTVLAEVESTYGKKAWAALGLRSIALFPAASPLTSGQFCWGGKVVALTSGIDTPWKVSAQCHPGMLNMDDAAKVTIPMCVLGSEEEKAEDLDAFGNALNVEKHVERFNDQLHGWMSARADLEDVQARKEYERGYKTILDFSESISEGTQSS